jgi:hypothetical protein
MGWNDWGNWGNWGNDIPGILNFEIQNGTAHDGGTATACQQTPVALSTTASTSVTFDNNDNTPACSMISVQVLSTGGGACISASARSLPGRHDHKGYDRLCRH